MLRRKQATIHPTNIAEALLEIKRIRNALLKARPLGSWEGEIAGLDKTVQLLIQENT